MYSQGWGLHSRNPTGHKARGRKHSTHSWHQCVVFSAGVALFSLCVVSLFCVCVSSLVRPAQRMMERKNVTFVREVGLCIAGGTNQARSSWTPTQWSVEMLCPKNLKSEKRISTSLRERDLYSVGKSTVPFRPSVHGV